MASEVGICNTALAWLGGQIIISLDDEITEAKLCKAIYYDILEAMLQEYDWTFAVKRYNLPKLALAPAHGYSSAFHIPPEVIKINDVVDNNDWQVEGQDIVTNNDNVRIVALVAITDPN